jgi:hypothetical protein
LRDDLITYILSQDLELRVYYGLGAECVEFLGHRVAAGLLNSVIGVFAPG